MSKYIHLFETESDFDKAVNGEPSTSTTVTSITVNGTLYVYSGQDQNDYYIWVNPEDSEDWVDTYNIRDPKVGDSAYILGGDMVAIEEVHIPGGTPSIYIEPWVSYTMSIERVDYNKKRNPLIAIPLTLEILEDGVLIWPYPDGFDVQYKKNDGEWTDLPWPESVGDFYEGGISLVSGDTISFRGNNTGQTSFYDESIRFMDSEWNDKKYNISGNIMSLVSRTDFENLDTIPSNTTFAGLFKYTYVVNAKDLLLPATGLSDSCYNGLFDGCEELLTAPELPATRLSNGCYTYMFGECPKLTVAPTIPATTVSTLSCNQMFRDCTSLTTVQSVLPAMIMANGCYQGMFQGCTSLTTAPELPATTLDKQCYDSMFSGCITLTTAPELPAETLADFCYRYMFNNCTSLNNVKCLATDISATDCVNNWLHNVASSGTFTKASSMSDWPTGDNGIPSGWTVLNA